MKIICDGLDLAEASAVVARIANARAVNPILEGIKLVAAGGTLTLCATDLEIYVQKVIRADVKVEGTVLVPGRLFADYVKKLGGHQISITSEGSSVIITHGDNVCSFQCLTLAEYPDIVNLNARAHFSIRPGDLRDVIAKCASSASQDDSRPVLKGICFELVGNKLTAVALDNFRLAKVEKEIANYGEDIKIILPARSLEEVKKMLGDEAGEISIVIENKFFQVNISKTVLASRLIDGIYVNYSEIMPASFASSVVVERVAFEDAVSRAGLLTHIDKVNLVSLKITDKQILATSNNDMGKIEEKVAAKLEGQDITLTFNAKYLHDALRNISSEFIRIDYNGEAMPCVITGAKQSDFLFLIVPVRRT